MPTGLTHLGAREYDPTLGGFLSVAPIIDTAEPAQMNAYSYAHNNPLTKSDPDGLRPDGPAGGASYNDDRWSQVRGGNSGYTYKSSKWVWHFTPKKDPDSKLNYASYRADPARFMRPQLPAYVPDYQIHRPVNRQNGPDVAGAIKRGASHVKNKVSDLLATDGEANTTGVCIGARAGRAPWGLPAAVSYGGRTLPGSGNSDSVFLRA
ncbi:RHS repeat-associated core domain-containing protein [Streptomyces sp. NPDC013181]|uniref:RHS repeat-associated core domain-containing protein n=1 Tax=Streptomyces sp. NPDC013181 TaxID=3364864 RepID=UPI003691983D